MTLRCHFGLHVAGLQCGAEHLLNAVPSRQHPHSTDMDARGRAQTRQGHLAGKSEPCLPAPASPPPLGPFPSGARQQKQGHSSCALEMSRGVLVVCAGHSQGGSGERAAARPVTSVLAPLSPTVRKIPRQLGSGEAMNLNTHQSKFAPLLEQQIECHWLWPRLPEGSLIKSHFFKPSNPSSFQATRGSGFPRGDGRTAAGSREAGLPAVPWA